MSAISVIPMMAHRPMATMELALVSRVNGKLAQAEKSFARWVSGMFVGRGVGVCSRHPSIVSAKRLSRWSAFSIVMSSNAFITVLPGVLTRFSGKKNYSPALKCPWGSQTSATSGFLVQWPWSFGEITRSNLFARSIALKLLVKTISASHPITVFFI